MKELIITGTVAGVYTAVREYVRLTNATIYQYPYLLDMGAIALGWFARKYMKSVGDALIIGGSANAVKELAFYLMRSSYNPQKTEQS